MERLQCPRLPCKELSERGRVVLFGFFRRKEDGRKIRRFRCLSCERTFSTSTSKPEFRQHKRRINNSVRWLLCSKVSQRRSALKLRINVKTVARKLIYLGELGRQHLEAQKLTGLMHVQFDEMQAAEHSKCKPVAIPMVVEAETERILAVGVASMPAQHPLAEIALAKYGPRKDDRPEAIAAVLKSIKSMLGKGAQISTDSALHYPEPIKQILPGAVHSTSLSRRARSVGQGELKRGRNDPLFWFNHTAGMVRDGAPRLVRKTWGNTKRIDRLADHLALYAHFHNEVLLPLRKKKKGKAA